jgi:hypothetical protein
MNPTKILLVVIMAGIVAFAAGKASAVQGTVTISGTASFQDYTPDDCAIVKNHKIDQRLILQMLAEATGDASITNKPTRLIYDPDAVDTAWSISDQYDGVQYGVFYYSNSVAGLKKLSGAEYWEDGFWLLGIWIRTDSGYNYYSYIELDSYGGSGWGFSSPLGFAHPYYTEYSQMAKEGSTSVSLAGHATLYVHSGRYNYNLPSRHFYANNCYGYYNTRAIAIHGLINLKGDDKGSTISQSFTLQGTGDGVWYEPDMGQFPLMISKGSVKFQGTGPD